MYVLYCRTVKRKIKYKVKCVSNELIQHCLGIEKCFNDVNNTVVVNSDNVYPCDKLLRLIGEENCNHRYVYVITERDCEKDQMLVSENLHHNLCNKKFSSPLRLLNFHLSSVRFADEISISLVSLPYDINNSICDSVLERYFKTPKLVNKGDIISIDIKYFATDLFFLNTKLNNVENIFFVCKKIVIQNVEVEEGCCCVIGETAIKQDVNIQSSIPKKLTNFIRKEDGTLIKEVPSCPYGLQENLENMQKAIRPFMGRRKFNLQPAFLLVGVQEVENEFLCPV
ncbi:hypothetical protein JTB14_031601 [Gonioctena quinquepunctata]|nr:hypothetical protein JTB14_031601 [Gonioctena quinquepunctata]